MGARIWRGWMVAAAVAGGFGLAPAEAGWLSIELGPKLADGMRSDGDNIRRAWLITAGLASGYLTRLVGKRRCDTGVGLNGVLCVQRGRLDATSVAARDAAA